MTKISKILTGAAALAVMGVAILPAAGYAVESTNLTVEVLISAQDDTNAGGGNDPDGYTWSTVDADGTKLNMTTAGDFAGGTTGGISPIGSAAATVTGTNKYGIKYTPKPLTLPAGDLTVTSTNYLPVTGTAQTIASSDAPGTIMPWATTDAVDKSVVLLGESHDATLVPGNYSNTITITQTNN